MWAQDLSIEHGKKSVHEKKKMEGECFRPTEIPRIDYSLDMLILYNMGKCMPNLPMLFAEKQKKHPLKRDY